MIAARCALLTFVLATCCADAAAAKNGDWETPAETMRFRTTPSYAQVREYLERLTTAAPRRSG